MNLRQEKKISSRIIQSLWIGNDLSVMEQLCLQSFLQNGYDFHLYAYHYINNMPSGVTLQDANSIIPEVGIFKDSRQGVASFSDWFRYQLLYEKGGWWVDMDTICLKYFDVDAEYCFATERNYPESEERTILNNGFIKSTPKAEFLKDILEYINSKDHRNIKWGEFGPILLTSTLKNYESKQYIKAPEVFCPINWYEIYKLITINNDFIDENTLAIHLWNHMWQRSFLNKEAKYHPKSIYEEFKNKYGITEY